VQRTVIVLMMVVLALRGLALLPDAAAAPVAMARGVIVTFQAPEFAYPGQRLLFHIVAMNNGAAPGCFRICLEHFNNIGDYYPEYHHYMEETAVNCGITEYLKPGETVTYDFNRFLMQSVPFSPFRALLIVQQEDLVMMTDEYGNEQILNMSVDAQVDWSITNPTWTS